MQDELTPNSKVDGKRIGEDAGSLACDALSVLRVAEEKAIAQHCRCCSAAYQRPVGSKIVTAVANGIRFRPQPLTNLRLDAI